MAIGRQRYPAIECSPSSIFQLPTSIFQPLPSNLYLPTSTFQLPIERKNERTKERRNDRATGREGQSVMATMRQRNPAYVCSPYSNLQPLLSKFQIPKPRTQNTEHRTQNPEPKTQNPKPRTPNTEPRTPNAEPGTHIIPFIQK